MIFQKNFSLKDIHTEKNYNLVQIFFSLENNRYRLDPKTSFKKSADELFVKITKLFPGGQDALDLTNATLQNQLNFCRETEIATKIPLG